MNPLRALWGRLTAKPTATLAAPQSAPLYRQQATFQLFDFLAGIPDPDEVLRRTGRTRADLRQLARDSEVSQALDTRREAVIATPWRLEPYRSRAEKFIYGALEPHVVHLIAAFWEAVPYGYSVVEQVYAREAGRVGIDAIHAPPFEWFKPLPDGSLRYFPQDGSGGVEGKFCDPRKFTLATRNASYRNPYGDALLSPLYWPVTWRLQGWQLWLQFLDTFSSPLLIGMTANFNAFVKAMEEQGVTKAVGWQPSGPDEKLQVVNASAPGEFERLDNALNRTIAKVVLGQTLTSDVGKTGSFAAAKVHDEVRDDKRRADIRVVMGAMQQVVNSLWLLNGFPGDAPRFVMQDDVGLETERAERDAILAQSLGLRFTPQYIVERYDLEEGDFTVVDPTPAPVPGEEGGAPAPRGTVQQAAVALRAGRFTPEQQAVEDAVDAVLETLPAPLERAALASAIRGARTPEELYERLGVALDQRDPAYTEKLARAIFAAHVLGYVHDAEKPTAP